MTMVVRMMPNILTTSEAKMMLRLLDCDAGDRYEVIQIILESVGKNCAKQSFNSEPYCYIVDPPSR